MARSEYIYLLYHQDYLMSVYTVKHEMLSFLSRWADDAIEDATCERRLDGGTERSPVTKLDLPKELAAHKRNKR